MNHIKKVLTKVKNHVSSHKFAYAASVVAIGAIALQQANSRAFYEFLAEKDINPMEFYNPELVEELQTNEPV